MDLTSRNPRRVWVELIDGDLLRAAPFGDKDEKTPGDGFVDGRSGDDAKEKRVEGLLG